jgi:hypothetical protein
VARFYGSRAFEMGDLFVRAYGLEFSDMYIPMLPKPVVWIRQALWKLHSHAKVRVGLRPYSNRWARWWQHRRRSFWRAVAWNCSALLLPHRYVDSGWELEDEYVC